MVHWRVHLLALLTDLSLSCWKIYVKASAKLCMAYALGRLEQRFLLFSQLVSYSSLTRNLTGSNILINSKIKEINRTSVKYYISWSWLYPSWPQEYLSKIAEYCGISGDIEEEHLWCACRWDIREDIKGMVFGKVSYSTIRTYSEWIWRLLWNTEYPFIEESHDQIWDILVNCNKLSCVQLKVAESRLCIVSIILVFGNSCKMPLVRMKATSWCFLP